VSLRLPVLLLQKLEVRIRLRRREGRGELHAITQSVASAAWNFRASLRVLFRCTPRESFWRGVLEAESVGSSGWLRFDGQRVTAQELAPHVQLFRLSHASTLEMHAS
jgi:hypothetical protein